MPKWEKIKDEYGIIEEPGMAGFDDLEDISDIPEEAEEYEEWRDKNGNGI